MAYDQEGRYYFNPEMDTEDATLLDQTDKLAHAMQYKERISARQSQEDFQRAVFQESLKGKGMTEEGYNQGTPNQRAIIDAEYYRRMGNLAKQAAQGGSVSQPETKTPIPTQETVTESDEQELIALRKKAQTQGLNEDEELQAVTLKTKGLNWI